MAAVTNASSSQRCASSDAASRTWLGQILHESGFAQGMVRVPPGRPAEEGLLDRTNGWGNKGALDASKNSGRMGYSWNVSDELLDEVLHWTHRAPPPQAYGLMVEWYLTGGPKVESIPRSSAAYGPRDA